MTIQSLPVGSRLLLGERGSPKEVLGLRVVRELGRGSMGVVFEVFDERSSSKAAIKIMGTPEDAELRRRFLREARASQRLVSPYALRVLEVGELDDDAKTPFMLTEVLEGMSLGDLLMKQKSFSAPVVVKWCREALHALAEAHAIGLVHRDLKPDNLFVVASNNTIKVIDFGIVKDTAATQSLTKTGEGFGSPAYMSPEQIRGDKDLDPRADIWSLGVTMFELLTGRLPFDQESVTKVFWAVLNTVAPRVRDFRPEVPSTLDAVIARCLEPDRDHRYPTAKALDEALDEALEEARGMGQSPIVTSPAPTELGVERIHSRDAAPGMGQSPIVTELGVERIHSRDAAPGMGQSRQSPIVTSRAPTELGVERIHSRGAARGMGQSPIVTELGVERIHSRGAAPGMGQSPIVTPTERDPPPEAGKWSRTDKEGRLPQKRGAAGKRRQRRFTVVYVASLSAVLAVGGVALVVGFLGRDHARSPNEQDSPPPPPSPSTTLVLAPPSVTAPDSPVVVASTSAPTPSSSSTSRRQPSSPTATAAEDGAEVTEVRHASSTGEIYSVDIMRIERPNAPTGEVDMTGFVGTVRACTGLTMGCAAASIEITFYKTKGPTAAHASPPTCDAVGQCIAHKNADRRIKQCEPLDGRHDSGAHWVSSGVSCSRVYRVTFDVQGRSQRR